ncbi:MAG: hypothetical protein U9N83_02110 [Thermodesulfobacteriota bacterium]|nr:hypothetical protein [Thermodesulfobacteriota bacterium]
MKENNIKNARKNVHHDQISGHCDKGCTSKGLINLHRQMRLIAQM